MPTPIINRVPVGIFSEIFRLTYNQKSPTKGDNDLYPGPVQTTLSLVCKAWREVVNLCHFLWEEINLHYRITHDSRPYDPQSCLFSSFLSIASCWVHPFIIKLTFTVEAPIDANQWCLSDIIDNRAHSLGVALMPQAARLKTFSITTSSWQAHTSFLQALNGAHFPILEKWDSIFKGADEGIIPDMAGPEDHIDIFRPINFLSLCHLSLIGVPCHWSEFQLHNLVSLNIAQMSPPFKLHPRCLEHILQQNRGSLQKLSLQDSLYEDPQIYAPQLFDNNYPKLFLPHIKELTLGFMTPQEITPFLSCITTSQLRKLIIRNINSPIPKAQMLLPLLSSAVSEWPSLARLQQVTLQHMHVGKEDVMITLQQCEDLLEVLEQEIQDDDQVDDVGDDAEADDDSETGMSDDNGSEHNSEFGWDTDFSDGVED